MLDGDLVADAVKEEPALELSLPDLERDAIHRVEVQPGRVQDGLAQKLVHLLIGCERSCCFTSLELTE